MKVCHISSAHAPNDTRIFHKQCASLARAGYDTTFVVKAKDPQSVGETTERACGSSRCRWTPPRA